MLWFNVTVGVNFIFFCYKLIIIYYHTQKQRKIKFQPRMKLNHNICIYCFVYQNGHLIVWLKTSKTPRDTVPPGLLSVRLWKVNTTLPQGSVLSPNGSRPPPLVRNRSRCQRIIIYIQLRQVAPWKSWNINDETQRLSGKFFNNYLWPHVFSEISLKSAGSIANARNFLSTEKIIKSYILKVKTSGCAETCSIPLVHTL